MHIYETKKTWLYRNEINKNNNPNTTKYPLYKEFYDFFFLLSTRKYYYILVMKGFYGNKHSQPFFILIRQFDMCIYYLQIKVAILTYIARHRHMQDIMMLKYFLHSKCLFGIVEKQKWKIKRRKKATLN